MQVVDEVVPIVPETVTVPVLGVFPAVPAPTVTVTDPVPLDDVGAVVIQA